MGVFTRQTGWNNLQCRIGQTCHSVPRLVRASANCQLWHEMLSATTGHVGSHIYSPPWRRERGGSRGRGRKWKTEPLSKRVWVKPKCHYNWQELKFTNTVIFKMSCENLQSSEIASFFLSPLRSWFSPNETNLKSRVFSTWIWAWKVLIPKNEVAVRSTEH